MSASDVIFLISALCAIYWPQSGQASYWNQQVFPDDEHWLFSLAKSSTKNGNDISGDTKNYAVCETPECKRVADEFLSSLNKTVDPCDNFYDFTCSGWNVNSPIPPSLPAWSRFLMFQMTVNHRIKGILETEPELTDILPVRQAKKWYRTCMDTETLEQRGIKPIESILLRAGGWPISMDEEEWDETEYTWKEVERSYFRLTGALTFFDVAAYPPTDDEEDYGTIKIAPQNLPLSDHMPIKYRNYSGNEYELYVNFVVGVADMFIEGHRASVSKEKLTEDAKEIVEFEKKLFQLQKEEQFEVVKFQEFVQIYNDNVANGTGNFSGKIDWQALIDNLFDTVNIKVDPQTDLYFPSVDYILGIGELLETTPTRTIVNYIHWKFVADMLTYTTEGARDYLYDLLMGEYGIKERPPRWSECVKEMQMAHAAAYAFVNKHISKESESAVLKMANNIRIGMEKQIDRSTWLDEKSKTLAKEKLNAMKMFVGFPDWYKNKKAVLKSYKGLTIGTEYLDNTLSYMRYEKKKALKKLAPQLEDEQPWPIDPITVNAIYDEDENTLNVPAADFQAPFFTSQIPDYVNYGIVGLLVGHEMGHGFDDTAIKHGTDGGETKLSEKILESYFKRADCFIDQFDTYYGETKAPETTGSPQKSYKRRKSEFTRSENIADSTGMQAVFEAYKKLKKPGGNVRLVGLEEFTDDQLFFLSFGAMWCEVETPEYAKKKKEARDPHSPAKIRVIAAVSNTKGFAEAFNCPVGSPMNPVDKCNIWGDSVNPRKPQSAWKREKPNRWEGQWKI